MSSPDQLPNRVFETDADCRLEPPELPMLQPDDRQRRPAEPCEDVSSFDLPVEEIFLPPTPDPAVAGIPLSADFWAYSGTGHIAQVSCPVGSITVQTFTEGLVSKELLEWRLYFRVLDNPLSDVQRSQLAAYPMSMFVAGAESAMKAQFNLTDDQYTELHAATESIVDNAEQIFETVGSIYSLCAWENAERTAYCADGPFPTIGTPLGNPETHPQFWAAGTPVTLAAGSFISLNSVGQANALAEAAALLMVRCGYIGELTLPFEVGPGSEKFTTCSSIGKPGAVKVSDDPNTTDALSWLTFDGSYGYSFVSFESQADANDLANTFALSLMECRYKSQALTIGGYV